MKIAEAAAAQSPRLLLIPSSGMGHLIPFVRLASALTARNISITLLASRPTVSLAESRLLSSLPSSLLHDFSLPVLDPSLFPPSTDPFFLRMESLLRSAHLISPLFSSFSALIIDISAASTFVPAAAAANIPCFVLFPSCAAMLALCVAFASNEDTARSRIPPFALPQPLRDPTHVFTTLFVGSGRALARADGILMNTFEAMEAETIAELRCGKVVPNLPPVYDIGPLPLLKNQEQDQCELMSSGKQVVDWLDRQGERSVMYVSFGSRTAMSGEQMGELGAGLEMSGWPFLWMVKRAKVDREEERSSVVVEQGRG